MNVTGLNVVVTGKIEGESRLTAEAKLRALGARTQGTVTSSTDLLVTGASVGKSKTAKAEQLGVRVVPWEQAINGAQASPVEAVEAVGTLTTGQVAPQLALGSDTAPTGPGWQHEIKWDGVRCIATVKAGAVAMQSRSDKTDYTQVYPSLVPQIVKLPDGVYDGEIVVLIGEGGSFEQLRDGSGGDASFVVFDCLEQDGVNLRHAVLGLRREAAERAVAAAGLTRVAMSPSFDDAEALLAYVAENGMEGIVSKRLASHYSEGARNGDWLKIKVRLSQEFVVIGYKRGEGGRAGHIGSILLGVYTHDGQLKFVGRCGTGTTLAGWDALRDRLTPDYARTNTDLSIASNRELRDVQWVMPDVVVQAEFQRWTEDGRCWHPSYKGVRDDKTATDVRREG